MTRKSIVRDGFRLTLKLSLIVAVLVLLQAFALSAYFRHASQKSLFRNAQLSMQSGLESSVDLMDSRLDTLLNRVIAFTTDETVFSIVSSSVRDGTAYDQFDQRKRMESLLDRYFQEFSYLSGSVVVSPAMSTYSDHYHIDSYDRLFAIDQFSENARYPYTQWLRGDEGIPGKGASHGLLVRKLNCMKYNDELLTPLPADVPPHFLVLPLNENLYRDSLGNGLIYPGMAYSVWDATGALVTASGTEAQAVEPRFAEDGVYRITDAKQIDRLVCQVTSAVTGWRILMHVPVRELSDPISVRRSELLSLLLLLSVTTIIIASFFIIVLMRPMKTLIEGTERIGRGDFDTLINVAQEGEFRQLASAMNEMTLELKKLINENYEIRLKEQEARIMALELQINPHLVYNTLNTINFMIEKGDRACASQMVSSLCSLLQYASNRAVEVVTLEADLEWIHQYLYIMSIRFPERYTVYTHIDQDMYDCVIPKLILQPILENSILHGLAEKEFSGVIDIRAIRRDDMALLIIRDNGVGIQQDQLPTLLKRKTAHIGLNNVHNRIQLMYGERYGLSLASTPGEFTEVTVLLPYQRAAEVSMPTSPAAVPHQASFLN